MISILSSALIMRMKVQLITYQRDQCSLNRSLNDRQADLYTFCLFDSGSTNTLINQRSVPPDIPAKSGASQSFTTIQGIYESSKILISPTFASQEKPRKFKSGYLVVQSLSTMSSSAVTSLSMDSCSITHEIQYPEMN